jgi:hypothetical protein
LAPREALDAASVTALETGRYHVVGDELERVAGACGVELELLTEGRAELR